MKAAVEAEQGPLVPKAELMQARQELQREGGKTTQVSPHKGRSSGEELAFVLRNKRLETLTRGIGYRRSMHLNDKDDDRSAAWGSTVRGTLKDHGWLRVGDRYLPMCIDGEPVMILKADAEPRESAKADVAEPKRTLDFGAVPAVPAEEPLLPDRAKLRAELASLPEGSAVCAELARLRGETEKLLAQNTILNLQLREPCSIYEDDSADDDLELHTAAVERLHAERESLQVQVDEMKTEASTWREETAALATRRQQLGAEADLLQAESDRFRAEHELLVNKHEALLAECRSPRVVAAVPEAAPAEAGQLFEEAQKRGAHVQHSRLERDALSAEAVQLCSPRAGERHLPEAPEAEVRPHSEAEEQQPLETEAGRVGELLAEDGGPPAVSDPVGKQPADQLLAQEFFAAGGLDLGAPPHEPNQEPPLLEPNQEPPPHEPNQEPPPQGVEQLPEDGDTLSYMQRYAAMQVEELQRQAEQYAVERQALEDEKREIVQQIEFLRATCTALRTENDELASRFDEAGTDNLALSEKVRMLDAENAKLKEEWTLKGAETGRSISDPSLQDRQPHDCLGQAEVAVAGLQKEVAELREEREALAKQHDAAAAESERLRSEVASLDSAWGAAVSEAERLCKEALSSEAEKAKLAAQLEGSQVKHAALERDHDDLSLRLQEALTEHRALSAEHEALAQQERTHCELAARHAADAEQLRGSYAQLEAEHGSLGEDLRLRAATLQEEVSQLEAENRMLANKAAELDAAWRVAKVQVETLRGPAAEQDALLHTASLAERSAAAVGPSVQQVASYPAKPVGSHGGSTGVPLSPPSSRSPKDGSMGVPLSPPSSRSFEGSPATLPSWSSRALQEAIPCEEDVPTSREHAVRAPVKVIGQLPPSLCQRHLVSSPTRSRPLSTDFVVERVMQLSPKQHEPAQALTPPARRVEVLAGEANHMQRQTGGYVLGGPVVGGAVPAESAKAGAPPPAEPGLRPTGCYFPRWPAAGGAVPVDPAKVGAPPRLSQAASGAVPLLSTRGPPVPTSRFR